MIGVVGSTGLVGQTLLEIILKNKIYHPEDLILCASESSIGKKLSINGKTFALTDIEDMLRNPPSIVFFMANEEIAKKYAFEFVKAGSFVIDNSSAFRLDPNVPLVVPGINENLINESTRLIANPNCSTIQLCLSIFPLIKNGYEIEEIFIATYQSVSGAGKEALNQLKEEQNNISGVSRVFDATIFDNLIPICGGLLPGDVRSKEEIKIEEETKKILNINPLIMAIAVRVPITIGHSEAVFLKVDKNITQETLVSIYSREKNYIIYSEDAKSSEFPMPINVRNSDFVHISRLRVKNSKYITLFNSANNLRVGAATNAIRIAQEIRGKCFNVRSLK